MFDFLEFIAIALLIVQFSIVVVSFFCNRFVTKKEVLQNAIPFNYYIIQIEKNGNN